MLRSLLAAFATARAASQAKQFATNTAYGLIAISALMIGLIFASIALFFTLAERMGPASAAAIVAVVVAALAVGVALYARWKDSQEEDDDMYDQLGLSSLGISSGKDVEAVVRQARRQIRKVGPVNVALAALAAGFLLGRR
jgi:hypothetical protein